MSVQRTKTKKNYLIFFHSHVLLLCRLFFLTLANALHQRCALFAITGLAFGVYSSILLFLGWNFIGLEVSPIPRNWKKNNVKQKRQQLRKWHCCAIPYNAMLGYTGVGERVTE